MQTGGMVPLTVGFDELIKSQLQERAGFRKAYLCEAISCLISGDIDTGKSVLRKYINGTVGFVKLGADLGHSSKTLMRMFSPSGNPQARNLFQVIAYLQKAEGAVLEVVARTAA